MSNERVYKIPLLQHILSVGGEATIGVSGVSMEPTLVAGDTIRVVKGDYKSGDILVFPYKYGELLVHRYVGEQHGRILCKGDNAFRLEDIELEAVLGKVVSLVYENIQIDIPPLSEALITMSWEIGKLFRRNRYDVAKTSEEPLFTEFRDSMVQYSAFRGH